MSRIDLEKEEHAAQLRGSYLEFARFFYEHITGRRFIVSQPIGRESHHITIAKALTKTFNLESLRLIINVPPGHNKSTMLSLWVAWCWAHYPDSNFLYISYSQEISAKHTAFIKSIVSSRMYRYLFDIELDNSSRAKDHFKTTAGGTIMAFGTNGSITGMDGGLLLDAKRFGGAIIMDDTIKLAEAHSDAVRHTVKTCWDEAIRQRARGLWVPIISIEQRSHEDDLPAHLLSGKDVDDWELILLPALDSAENALYPEFISKDTLLRTREKSPYVFASQMQQNPMPAGGALYKPHDFPILDEEPKLELTFITADTAETTKSWNDATVFSFWGLYEIETLGRKTGQMALHWLDCIELRIEPKDLKDSFLDFYQNCMRHPIAPILAAIEKKSTGVTLLSVLKELRGIQIREINRNAHPGNNGDVYVSKSDRFVAMQSFIASKQISLPCNAIHNEMCLNHMSKITANNTHRFDDIADTVYDAIRIALIEKSLYNTSIKEENSNLILENMEQSLQRKMRIGDARYGRR